MKRLLKPSGLLQSLAALLMPPLTVEIPAQATQVSPHSKKVALAALVFED